MKRLRGLCLMAVVMLLLSGSQKQVLAETEGVSMDFIFVIDNSTSMKKNDPSKHVFDVMERMIVLDTGSQNRVGYVVYNDSIIKDKGLVAGSQVQEDLAGLKGLTFTNGTDVGLGMKTAYRLLAEQKYQKGRTAMIVLSDGDIEVSKGNPNRTQAACDQDIQQVLGDADFPIYTVQYSEAGKSAQAPMNTWGTSTGGKDYFAASADGDCG